MLHWRLFTQLCCNKFDSGDDGQKELILIPIRQTEHGHKTISNDMAIVFRIDEAEDHQLAVKYNNSNSRHFLSFYKGGQ